MERVKPCTGKCIRMERAKPSMGNTSEWKGLNQVWENTSEWKMKVHVCTWTRVQTHKPLYTCILETPK